ncbi:uncharacterized protein LOC103697113 isoform X5 [Phoenix dactylifera]|uniref:Uncharacterized protein LOC103697113 isoform X5 n=1 Tax=Phoenix dactylifera TaxID=42345 RepID=A0A8B7BHW3_PHODC|nr:uncharacterized protein LOC103697113 isoform X5 [Phoenix dactylifera]
MAYPPWPALLFLHCLFFTTSLSLPLPLGADIKALTVGDEIKNDPLPLHMGQRIYELRGLRESAWYEVKISYPVSIPARFSIQLKTGESELWLRKNRRLLNTEKLIFKADGHRPVYVIVTVEAEGFVAKPNLKERELAVFNIGLLCLVLALVIPSFLPPHLLLRIASSQSSSVAATKVS